MPSDVENKPKREHGGGSMCIGFIGRAFHHHHGAVLDVEIETRRSCGSCNSAL